MNEPVHTDRVSLPKRAVRSHSGSAKELSRTNDPARTTAEILEVATREFAAKGLAGARIDEIAAATRTSKRMIYYYFGSKDGLYLAVLEEAYRRMRSIEADLHLEDLAPMDALRRLVGFTYDHHRDNEDFIRLVMSENVQQGHYLAQSPRIHELNVTAISALERLLARGVDDGVFRADLQPLEVHSFISALCFFNVSNRHTFGLIFQTGLKQAKASILARERVIDAMVRFVER
ncbi:MAG: TetR/AcrR family transcriptional regulator [Limnohabitans sp.]|nr:TetR/AcrR family transcriptional regulator [Limnohabitans sp.]